jgi:quercetin dioxygenase-like cupin family protein
MTDKTSTFIPPCRPTPRKEPPMGDGWLHEVKFDGFRVQIHKRGRDVALFSRGGRERADRYPAITEAVRKLPTKAVVLDAELTACRDDGWPSFSALLRGREAHLCIWVFDMLSQNGRDLRELPLASRRQKLAAVIRLKMPAGYKVPAHNHPTMEYVTVLSGEFHLGMGDKLDMAKSATLTAGGFAEAPAKMNHYGWAATDTVIQLHGPGPFGITYVDPAEDPSKK